MLTYGRAVSEISASGFRVPADSLRGKPSAYLDHAATSPLRDAAKAAMLEAWGVVGNPSSRHAAGRRARAVLEDARESIAADLAAHPTEVVLTSGGSEADTIAVLGSMEAAKRPAVVGALEHPAVADAKRFGALVWPSRLGGDLDPEWRPAVDPAVVSVMAVNNETGILGDLEYAAAKARQWGALLHTDAVQAIGHVEFSFNATPAVMASVSAHKLGGPVGIGALLIRREVTPFPPGLGGKQERDLRSGTQPVALACGFAAALREAVGQLSDTGVRWRGWQEQVVQAAGVVGGVTVVTDLARSAPHILNLSFDGVRGSDLHFLLDQAGIQVSVGSACKAGVQRPSEVLLAMGLDLEQAGGSIRVSFGHSTTDGEVALLCSSLAGAVERARAAARLG